MQTRGAKQDAAEPTPPHSRLVRDHTKSAHKAVVTAGNPLKGSETHGAPTDADETNDYTEPEADNADEGDATEDPEPATPDEPVQQDKGAGEAAVEAPATAVKAVTAEPSNAVVMKELNAMRDELAKEREKVKTLLFAAKPKLSQKLTKEAWMDDDGLDQDAEDEAPTLPFHANHLTAEHFAYKAARDAMYARWIKDGLLDVGISLHPPAHTCLHHACIMRPSCHAMPSSCSLCLYHASIMSCHADIMPI
jgi:hypothetical protein